ncbi:sulfotransferase [Phytohabitans houttuyneae]|uniref:sulfotransferase n=1 Tax=Phytohabitans houttuyneae TaxID=1076126 RepID=UPI0031EC741B
MALPHFLIAGVPKAGTTALHAALVRHPDLFLPSVKEPKFFLTDGPPPTRGGPGDAQTYQEHVWRREDYERLFDPAPPGALRGEATPFYLHHLDSHARIHRLVPDAKIILLLRDPVDRAHSNWTHLWTAGLEPEADFLTACRLEDQRKAAGWAAFWHYLDLGRYGAQVKHLYEYFPREQVLLMRYLELRQTPAAALDKVCAFLGVDTGVIDVVPAENVTRTVDNTRVNAALRYLLRTGAGFGQHFPVPLRKVFRGPLLTLLQRGHGRRIPLKPEDRAALLPAFADDIALLQEVTGQRYDDWLDADRHAPGRPASEPDTARTR